MSDENIEPEKKISKDDINRVYETTILNIQKLHEESSKTTQYLGYTYKILQANRPVFENLFTVSEDNPDLIPVVMSGYYLLNELSASSTEMIGQQQKFQESYILPMVNSTGSFGGTITTASKIAAIPYKYEDISFPNPLPGKTNDECIKRLLQIDQSIADSYSEVWETYYGTKADPQRSALYMMRQVFDTFFSKLAPDVEVRESMYWKIKVGEKPDQIYRSERINFAAHKHITDENTATYIQIPQNKLLIFMNLQIKHMIEES